MSLMLYVILLLLIVSLPTTIGESSSQHDLADSCSSLSDVRVDNKMIFAPIPSNDGSADSDVAVSLMLHVFINSLAAQGSAIISSVNQWIAHEHSANRTSLLNTWIRKTGLNISDIRFRVYLPSSISLQEQRNLTNITHIYSHLQNITILNESEWKKLGHDTIYYNSTDVRGCKSNFSIWFSGTLQEIRAVSDTNCPADFSKSCPRLTNYWERLCRYGLRQGDIFQFKFMPITDGNISVSLYHETIAEPEKVYELRNNDHGNFTLPEDGGYYIIIENIDHTSGYFNYNITHNCKNMTRLIDDWLNVNLLNQQEINVVLNEMRIKPVLLGQYEYITQSPFKIPGIVLLMKNIDSAGVVKELEYMPAWMAKAFGAAIQNEGTVASFKLHATHCNIVGIMLAMFQTNRRFPK